MTHDTAAPFGIRRCYQSAEMPVDDLLDVLCSLLLDSPEVSDCPQSSLAAPTCFSPRHE